MTGSPAWPGGSWKEQLYFNAGKCELQIPGHQLLLTWGSAKEEKGLVRTHLGEDHGPDCDNVESCQVSSALRNKGGEENAPAFILFLAFELY